MKNSNNNKTRFVMASASALLASFMISSVAPAQTQSVDSRWQPYLGCWVPDDASAAVGTNSVSGSMVCLVPVLNSQSVDVATISNRVVMHRERITTNGQKITKQIDNCPGWESSEWSADGNRIFVRSEFQCANNTNVKSSGVLALSADGNWVQVQGTSVGLASNTRVLRYHPADVALAPNSVISDSSTVQTVPIELGFAQRAMRAQLGVKTDSKALLDIAKHVDQPVAQAWLSEFGVSAYLNAKELVAMSEAGMPPALIDMMVAMANPARFQLQVNTAQGNYDVTATDNQGDRPSALMSSSSAACSRDLADLNMNLNMNNGYLNARQMYCLNRFGVYGNSYFMNGFGGWGFNNGYYGYPYGYRGTNYYGNTPVIIVSRNPGNTTQSPVARAVKGGGYTQSGGSSSTGSSTPRTTFSPERGSSSSSPSSTSGGSSSGGSSSGGTSTGRTAIPRPPGGN